MSKSLQGAHPPQPKRVSQVLGVDAEQAGPPEGSKMDQRSVLSAAFNAWFRPLMLRLSSTKCALLQAGAAEAAAGGMGSFYGGKARPRRGAP